MVRSSRECEFVKEHQNHIVGFRGIRKNRSTVDMARRMFNKKGSYDVSWCIILKRTLIK